VRRVLGATPVPTIPPVRKPLLPRENKAGAGAEAEFVTVPSASGEPGPKNEQGIVWDISFNHQFQPLSGTVRRTL